ncbi:MULTISPECIES: hypothetical protein [unclassified Eisenbergiella]|uniref:hypothetical protein n=1 Tax=unclassified Eisenbergiella TaxID=2652273 RepID=UPI0015FD1A44|nr:MULTISPECIES: hypothetical protein [unclassified Eisenbergiella]MBS5534512.1 hypothetical protein [Lachnospiraceae bacterium]
MGKQKMLDCLQNRRFLFSHLASEATQRTLVFSGFCPSAAKSPPFMLRYNSCMIPQT